MQGYAIKVKGQKYGAMCYTSAPEILGGGSVWQIYKTRRDAEKFLEVPFGDAEYEIIAVDINDKDTGNGASN